MEILKNKKIIVGGLAVIGGIALVSYLLKPKSPKQNSEGFFNAGGMTLPNLPTNPFIPTSFTRQDSFCKLCVLYEKTINGKGVPVYTKRLTSGNTMSLEVFSITEQEFAMAFTKHGLCGKTPPTK
jgi:hypothetical protein